MRRVPAVLLLLLIAGAAAWTLYRWNASNTDSSDPWKAVPAQSALVLEFPDALAGWDRIMHTSQHWNALEQLPGMAAAGRLVARIHARMEDDPALRNALADAPVLVSVQRVGGQGSGALFVCAPRQPDEASLNAFTHALAFDAATVQQLLKGAAVDLDLDTALTGLAMAQADGLWLLATSRDVLDEALLELRNGQGLHADSLLTKARGTLGGGADAHVLIHLERTRNLLANWWTPDALKELEDMPNGWAALDLRVRSDALLMSGLVAPDGPHKAWTILEEQGSGELAILRSIPAGAEQLDMRHISDPRGWVAANEMVADDSLYEGLLAWVNGTVAIASSRKDSTTALWAFFGTDDTEKAANALTTYRPASQPNDTLHYRGQRLTRLPTEQEHERLMGSAFAGLERPWWTLLGDQVVFAATPQLLSQAVDAWYDGNSLAEDGRTSAWAARMSSTAGRQWWSDVSRSYTGHIQQLRPAGQPKATALANLWGRFGGITVQLSPGQRGMHHIMVGIQHVPLEVRTEKTLWSVGIGAPATRQPDIVVNHTNNTREVLVQDEQHRIHLISAAGKVLWQYALDGPIMGAVHQVDRFRNGKLQLLFNTAGRVYLIDRNGKDVGGFPVTLKEQASAPLAVFDYEGQRDYRVIVPLKDGRLFNIGVDGLPVKGWEARKLAHATTSAVTHVRIRNKDHLLVFPAPGRVLVLDRRGSEREKVTLELPEGARVESIRPGTDLSGTEVLWTDMQGTVYRSTLGGTTALLANGSAGAISIGAAWRTEGPELAQVLGDSLRVQQGAQQVWHKGFAAALLPAVQWYEVDGVGTVISVVLPTREELLLMDHTGSPLPGMPLKGATLCSIADLDLDGRPEVVTVMRNGQVIAQALPGRKTNAP
jgi:hypothetical protein